MGRVLGYAKKQGYTEYTSTLEEAWRISIQGLSDSLIQTLELAPEHFELGPHENFETDPVCKFAIEEAARHRERGIDLKMFLGLFKYYRQAYVDRLAEGPVGGREVGDALHWVNRIFDRLEIAFCSAWIELAEEERVRELQDTNRRLANEKNRFLTVTESLANPVLHLDRKGRLTYSNVAAAPLLGRSQGPGSFYYRRDGEEVPVPEWLAELTARARDRDGRLQAEISVPGFEDKIFEVLVHPMLDVSDKFLGWVVILHDITALRLAERALQDKADELERLSLTDPLTGLLNRRGLFTVGDKHVAMARRSGEPFRVLFGDVDNLKKINDRWGHATGDAALIALADAMRICFRTSDTVARVSGDEFVVLLPDHREDSDESVLQRLSDRLNKELARVQTGLSMSISTGWARFDPQRHSSFEALLTEADSDMYANKKDRTGVRKRVVSRV